MTPKGIQVTDAQGRIDIDALCNPGNFDAVSQFAGKIFRFDFGAIYQDYAEQIGRPELTDDEKSIALLNAILSLDFAEWREQ